MTVGFIYSLSYPFEIADTTDMIYLGNITCLASPGSDRTGRSWKTDYTQYGVGPPSARSARSRFYGRRQLRLNYDIQMYTAKTRYVPTRYRVERSFLERP